MKTDSGGASGAWDWILPVSLIFGLILLLSLNLGPSAEPAEMTNVLDAWLKPIAGFVAAGAEIAAALVIGVGVVGALIKWLMGLRGPAAAAESVRLDLGRRLALGLEFTIASDILRTAVAPTRAVIASLAAIVLLRTMLNYFLEREIEREEKHHGEVA